MLRFSRSFTRWWLVLGVVSILLAWPLHEAQHAREALGATAPVVSGETSGALDDGQDGDGESGAASCPWCLFHADHVALQGTPPAFRFAAESSAPPALLPGGLPCGRCALAAAPRGPPLA